MTPQQTSSDERILVLSAQVGNMRAFAALYRAYRPPLLRFAYKICHDMQLSEDAVQDAWLALTKNLKHLHDPTRFRAWVFRSVRWRLVDHIRKAPASHVALEESDVLREGALNIAEHRIDATGDQIGALLRKLELHDREAMHLFYLEDMSLKDIAQIQSVPIGTVKSRLNRARKRLHEAVNPRNDSDMSEARGQSAVASKEKEKKNDKP